MGNSVNCNSNQSDLSSLNASNLSSGTIPDARFPSTLPAVNGSQLTGISAGAGVTGITIKEEGSVVGTASSIKSIDFVGSTITATASGTEATVTVSGGGGLTSDAQRNTVGGTNAGDSFSGTDATDNTFIGYDAGTSYTTGDQSVIIGSKAGANANGLGNVFIGYYAGYDNQGGERNTITGWYSGENLTSGSYNSAYGANSLDHCQTGESNCAFGYVAAKKCTGSYNVCLLYTSPSPRDRTRSRMPSSA